MCVSYVSAGCHCLTCRLKPSFHRLVQFGKWLDIVASCFSASVTCCDCIAFVGYSVCCCFVSSLCACWLWSCLITVLLSLHLVSMLLLWFLLQRITISSCSCPSSHLEYKYQTIRSFWDFPFLSSSSKKKTSFFFIFLLFLKIIMS